MEQTEKKPFAPWDESKEFAIRSIKLYQYLTENQEKREYNLSKQFLMSATRIGDAVQQTEWLQAYHFAKSAQYWLELIHSGGYLTDEEVTPALEDVSHLCRMLFYMSHPDYRKEKAAAAFEQNANVPQQPTNAPQPTTNAPQQKGGAQ